MFHCIVFSEAWRRRQGGLAALAPEQRWQWTGLAQGFGVRRQGPQSAPLDLGEMGRWQLLSLLPCHAVVRCHCPQQPGHLTHLMQCSRKPHPTSSTPTPSTVRQGKTVKCSGGKEGADSLLAAHWGLGVPPGTDSNVAASQQGGLARLGGTTPRPHLGQQKWSWERQWQRYSGNTMNQRTKLELEVVQKP